MSDGRGRRRYKPDWPGSLGGGRRRNGRVALVIGAIIALVMLVNALTSDHGAGVETAATPTASPTAAVQSGTATGTPSRTVPNATAVAGLPPLPVLDAARSADAARVRVDRVIDGDTLDVRAGGEIFRVRVFGIDTTERGEACYSEGTARLRDLVGSEVILVPDVRLRDSNGRELRYVYTGDGRSVDATMVAEGIARAWRRDGALRDALVILEADAQAAGRGCLWAR